MVEKQVINTLLTNKDAFRNAIVYDNNIFSDPKISLLFKSMKDIYETGKDVDYSVIMSYLKKKGKYDFFKDDFFTELMTSGSCFNIQTTLKNLNQANLKKLIQESSKDLYQGVMKGEVDHMTFIEKIIELDRKIKDEDSSAVNTKILSDASLDDIFKDNQFLPFGIRVLDEMFTGIFNGNLFTIAGQPGAGKTTFALQLACEHKSLFISLEMTSGELYSKILSRLCEIPAIRIETKNLKEFEYKKILDVHSKIKEKIDMHIVTKISNFQQMYVTIKHYVETKDVQIVFIDYIQLIDAAGRDKNEKLEIMTEQLKLLAKQLNVPIVILSQLTKDSYKTGTAPTLADLRGSGSIGQNSDVVFILWLNSDEKYKLTVAKGRKYKIGTIDSLMLNGQYSRIEETFV